MIKFTLDKKTAEIINAAQKSAGDEFTPVVEGENELPLPDARQVWFTLVVLCDQKNPVIPDAEEGSPESFFGCLSKYQPALDVLLGDLAAAKPGMDLVSGMAGL